MQLSLLPASSAAPTSAAAAWLALASSDRLRLQGPQYDVGRKLIRKHVKDAVAGQH